MMATAEDAIEFIKNNQLEAFRELFAEDVSKGITDDQLTQLTAYLNMLFQKEGVPSGENNVFHGIQVSIVGADTIFINKIMYHYKSKEAEAFSKVLSFNFLNKYGTKKLFGVWLEVDGHKDQKLTIEQLNEFVFNIEDVLQFRIYYDEGRKRKTKFKHKIGYFAIEGDLNTLKVSRLKPIIEAVLEDLKQSRFEKVEVFKTSLDTGEAPSFVQIEILLKNKPYTIFLYLPIEDNGVYSDEIVLLQKEYANLGYKYILKQSDYKKITAELPKIGQLNLEEFYEDNP